MDYYRYISDLEAHTLYRYAYVECVFCAFFLLDLKGCPWGRLRPRGRRKALREKDEKKEQKSSGTGLFEKLLMNACACYTAKRLFEGKMLQARYSRKRKA